MNSVDIFPWNDNFRTGLPEVDAQHRKLVDLLNLLASHVAFQPGAAQLESIYDELAAYAVHHFATEEAIWREHLAGDEAEIAHRASHADFVETVTRLRQEQCHRSPAEAAGEALGFLARWLASHILESDRYLACVVHALAAGAPLAAAKRQARDEMAGATRALIDIILAIYEGSV